MRKRFALRMVLTFGCLSSVAFADGGDPSPVLTGTVNIVLANANGIVAVTDSNQTVRSADGEPFTSPLPGQKLFRIDDKTVCTIAGFGSKRFPEFPEFNSSAAGVLDRYIRELRTKGGTHGFHEKLTSLVFLFEHLLSGVGNLQHLHKEQSGDYGFELILAGYDTDGTAKLGKMVIGANLSPNGFLSPVLKELAETAVGQELVYKTAGIGGAAVGNILAYPAQLADDPAIARYMTSKVSDRGNSLTAVEMGALAKSLTRHSSMVNCHYVNGFRRIWWPVGGRDQTAILERGAVQKVEQPTLLFEQRRLDMPSFDIVMHSSLAAPPGFGLMDTSGKFFLYLKNVFQGGLAHLDGAYFFENDFSNVTLYYDGGILAFDPSNRVTDCVLGLGPHVDRKSHAVQELITRFHWKTVN